jgi:hypothetical protein
MTLQKQGGEVVAPEAAVAELLLTEMVARILAGNSHIGYARTELERAGHVAVLAGSRITVDHGVEAQLVQSGGRSWWNVYSTDGTPPTWTVGAANGETVDWRGAE